LVLGALAALSVSCTSDEVDKAAKKRIFSPEDPPKVVASASEKLAADGLADDARAVRRVLQMTAAEATERLGPHKFTAAVKFDWSGGDRPVELSEARTLAAGAGGVSGDFHATVQNSRDQGLEVMRVQGEVFARSRYGKFRQRLRDRGMAEREREEVFGALRDFDMLFRGRIRLESAGTVSHEGRTAVKYTVALAPPSAAIENVANLPPLAQPKNGSDPSTQRRQLFFEKRVPSALSGELLVDGQTAVVLKAKMEGKLEVPSTEKEKGATVRLTLDSALTEIGTDPKLKAPEEFLPDQDKPEGIAATLDRFGIQRTTGTDGGTPAPGKGTKGTAAEPEDETP
jgi:hypothetical protein